MCVDGVSLPLRRRVSGGPAKKDAHRCTGGGYTEGPFSSLLSGSAVTPSAVARSIW
jgi:hypothetical protein